MSNDNSTFPRPRSRRGGSGLGRVLRSLAGVDEAVLDQIPSERARYASMGGVVLGTALVATVSMSVALSAVFGGFNPIILIVVPIWGLFVLNLDRWLMSTSSGIGTRRRLAVLLPRLLLAVAFGVVIAEPLLLGVFRTAIEERVITDRGKDIVNYQSRLRTCNPVPGTPEESSPAARSTDCGKYRLVVAGGSPSATQRELEDLQAQSDALKNTIRTDADKHAALEEKARQECDGIDGPGLTGDAGVGYECERLRQQADNYASEHQIDKNNQKLAALTAKITTLTSAVEDSRQTYATRLNAAITDRVAERRAGQREIGLLERFDALGDLVKQSTYVHTAEWALRIFFILVDSLPVLVKFMSGTTPYDRLVTNLVESQERRQSKYHSRVEKQAGASDEVTQRQLDRELDIALRKVDQDALTATLGVNAERERVVDARAGYLLEEAWGGWWRPPRD